ncbi:hypothetical protein Barb7_00991 [Bacteroidales bacterium Barb7]|nr:hypothetical protein Barb7_00991 [Bacteroidales bacterium Barb7]
MRAIEYLAVHREERHPVLYEWVFRLISELKSLRSDEQKTKDCFLTYGTAFFLYQHVQARLVDTYNYVYKRIQNEKIILKVY